MKTNETPAENEPSGFEKVYIYRDTKARLIDIQKKHGLDSMDKTIRFLLVKSGE